MPFGALSVKILNLTISFKMCNNIQFLATWHGCLLGAISTHWKFDKLTQRPLPEWNLEYFVARVVTNWQKGKKLSWKLYHQNPLRHKLLPVHSSYSSLFLAEHEAGDTEDLFSREAATVLLAICIETCSLLYFLSLSRNFIIYSIIYKRLLTWCRIIKLLNVLGSYYRINILFHHFKSDIFISVIKLGLVELYFIIIFF